MAPWILVCVLVAAMPVTWWWARSFNRRRSEVSEALAQDVSYRAGFEAGRDSAAGARPGGVSLAGLRPTARQDDVPLRRTVP